MAGLIERTPAGQIFPAQAGSQIAFIESLARVLPIERDRLFARSVSLRRSAPTRRRTDFPRPSAGRRKPCSPASSSSSSGAGRRGAVWLRFDCTPQSSPPSGHGNGAGRATPVPILRARRRLGSRLSDPKPRACDRKCDTGSLRSHARARSLPRPPDRRSCARLSECDRRRARSGAVPIIAIRISSCDSSLSLQCALIARDDMRALQVVFLSERKRACCRSRACPTRSRIAAEGSSARSLEMSRYSTDGTSMWRSIRSRSGPEMRWR